MELGAATHPGHVRPENEDGFFASAAQAVFAVADGMGGHEAGEVASHLALDAVVQHAERLALAHATELPGRLHRAIQDANTAIYARAADQQAELRMGTTIVVATLHGDRLYFAHIGDSRLYLLRGDLFTQLTRDHSLVQTMVDNGELTPEEAAIHPLRHQITRVVGGGDYVSPEIASQTLEPGDIILLCTDGLSGVVSQEELRTILAAGGTCQEKADALIAAALRAGGPDNVTAVVVAYQRPHPLPETPHTFHAPAFVTPQALIGLLMVLFIGLFGFARWSFTHPQYYLGLSGTDHVALYQHYLGLPMLAPVCLTPPAARLPLAEVRPFLTNLPDIENGIPVRNLDAGIAMQKNLRVQVAEAIFAEVRRALEKQNLLAARAALDRARALAADPEQLEQLDRILEKKAREQDGPNDR